MSADNWGTCPLCAQSGIDPGPTFREDYEIYGCERGVIRVSYSGHCTECGCGLDFKHEHPIPGA